MGIWVELGIFVLVIVFALWQIHDVRKAREQTRKQREKEQAEKEQGAEPPSSGSA
ncbi:MAG: hypothetical protein ACK5YJ_00785 [Curvibacter sp.]|jgi:hypothetical protein|nr:hypothetical protein [Curvibacter sp.]